MQWLKLALKDTRDTYIGNIYIPPDGNFQTALDTIEIVMVEILALGNKDIVLMGDFNADLNRLTAARTMQTKEFHHTNQLEQLIKDTTRATEQSSTRIDHICVNRPEMYYQAGVYEAGIEDHSLIYTARKKWKEDDTTEYIWARSYRKYDAQRYQQDIESADWSAVMDESSDVNKATISFYKILLNIIEKHAPFKDIKCKGLLPTWFTNELMSLIDDRTYHLRRHKKFPTPENYRLRQEAINLVNHMKKELQREHAKNALDACKGDSKQTWKELKKLWPLKNKKSHIKEINGSTDPKGMANSLNDHFSSVGEKLAANFGDTEPLPVREDSPNDFDLEVTSNVETH